MAVSMERSRAVWWVFGLALLAVVALVVYDFLGTFVFGLFVYYSTRPVYRRVRHYVGPPSVAAVLSLVTLALPGILVLAYTVAIGVQEADAFLAANPDSLPQLQAFLERYVDVSTAVEDPRELLASEGLRGVLLASLGVLRAYLGLVATGLLHLFVMFAIAYYLLKDDRRLAAWVRDTFSEEEGVLVEYGRAVDRDFSNIFFGNILNAIITALIAAVVYNVLDVFAPAGLGIPFPTLLGLLTGVGSLIPVVGMKLVYVPVALYLGGVAVTTDPALLWFPVVFAALSLVVVDTIPDFVLRPFVSGRDLHLGLVMFAYIFGPLLWGWYGIFLGPIVLVLVIHFTRTALPALLGDDGDEREQTPELAETEAAPDADEDTDADEPPTEDDADDGGARGSGEADAHSSSDPSRGQNS